MNPEEEPQVNRKPEPGELNIYPVSEGSEVRSGMLRSALTVKKNGWKLNDDGSINADIIKFYDGEGTLRSTIEGVDLATEGIDGILIRTIADADEFSYLFGSAGFAMPGGTFDGSIAIPTAQSLVIGGGFITPNIAVSDNLRSGSDYQIGLTMGATISSVANSVTQKIPIRINGTQYYLLATTSSA